MKHAPLLALLAALWPALAFAQDVAGRFDYYVLSLSWQPSWCRSTGDLRDAAECRLGTGHDFTVHGLWPQHEDGYPEFCATDARDPSRRQIQAMSDLMAPGLAVHQWRKHGRCSGLSADAYFATLREAAESIAIPEVFDDLGRDLRLPPAVIEEAFVEANPRLDPDGVTVTCRHEVLHEVRVCLTRDLRPRVCAPDVRRDCAQHRLLMEKVR